MYIKFSHKYFKMPVGFERSTLLQVIPIDREDITDSLYAYDTAYPIGFNEVAYYQLPYRRLLLLLLKSNTGLLWTTIRPYREDKEQYYKRHCGEVFYILILEKED